MWYIEKIKIAQVFKHLPLISLGQGIGDDYELGDDDASFYAALECWDSNGGGNPQARASDEPDLQPEPPPGVASDIDTRTVTVTFFPNKSAQSQRRTT